MKTLALASALLLSAPAFANDATEYAQHLASTKVSLTTAIQTAETEVKGTAVSAELDDHRGKVVYEVEVLVGQKLFDVRLDVVNGTVLSVKEDI